MRIPSSPAETKPLVSPVSESSEDSPPSYDEVMSGSGGLHVAGGEESPNRASPSKQLKSAGPAEPPLLPAEGTTAPDAAPQAEEPRTPRASCSRSRNRAPPGGLCAQLGAAFADVRRELSAAQAEVARNLASARLDVERNLAEARADVHRNLAEADASVRHDLAMARRDVSAGVAQASRDVAEGLGGCRQRRSQRSCGSRRGWCS